MISASHNLYEDNGIKFFDGSGGKLSDELEERIEAQLAGEPADARLGRARPRAPRVDSHARHVPGVLRRTLPAGMDLAGLKIVIDCANGAAYKVAPRVLADLGADIVPIGCSPNGRNINDRLRLDGARAAAADGAGRARRMPASRSTATAIGW